MREYSEHEASEILSRAYDTLEQGPLEVRQPCHPDDDVLIKWQRLRERSQPPPRQVTAATMMASGSNGRTVSGNTPRSSMSSALSAVLRDERWFIDCLRSTLQKDGLLFEMLAKVLADQRKGMKDHVAAELAGLRREITQLRTQIKTLEQRQNVEASIALWHINRRRYSATPFDANGRAGPTINLRPLFEEYNATTS